MKIYPILSLAVVSLLPAALQADYSTSFTAAEGYSDGPLSNNENWNNALEGGIYTVDATAGQVDIGATGAGFGSLSILATSSYDFTQVGSTYTASMDFQFTDTNAAISGTNTFISMLYMNNPTGGSVNQTSLGIRRNASPGSYQLVRFAASTASLSASGIGIDIGSNDFVSDVLRMSYTLTAGETPSTWSATYSVYNVDTSTTVTSSTITVNVTSAAADDDSMYAALSTGANNGNGITDITMYDYASSAVIVPEPTTYAFAFGGLMLALVGFRRFRK